MTVGRLSTTQLTRAEARAEAKAEVKLEPEVALSVGEGLDLRT